MVENLDLHNYCEAESRAEIIRFKIGFKKINSGLLGKAFCGKTLQSEGNTFL